MNQLPIYILFWAISLLSYKLNAQTDSIYLETKSLITKNKDSISLKNKANTAGNLFIGVDLFNPIMSAFSDKQGGQAMVSYRIYKKWNAVAEIGYEKNKYDDLDWKVDVDGLFFKLGLNWYASQDHQNLSNGFYTGLRFAYAAYNQEINQYPIRLSNNQVDEYGSLPSEKVSSYWIELVGGGRIQLFSNFYADFSVRPEIYLGSKKQENIDPLVIPGYGKDKGPINFSLFWGLTYKLF